MYHPASFGDAIIVAQPWSRRNTRGLKPAGVAGACRAGAYDTPRTLLSMFFFILLAAWLLLPLYVGWRAGSVPWIARRVPAWARMAASVLLASGYAGARWAEGAGLTVLAGPMEWVGATSIGILFLLFVALLPVDLLTGFGWLFPRHAPRLRRFALAAGAAMSLVALVQGLRPPVVREFEIRLAGLPRERDGTVLLFVSDLHLGTQLGERWLTARLAQIAALRPDAILLGGDLLEGDSESERDLVPLLGRLSAPLGVWTVAGNHDGHGVAASGLQALETRGVGVLRNQWSELRPGLIVAGIEDARSHRDPPVAGNRLERALAGRPAGAIVLISHAPSQVEQASAAGVGLMVAGHTHDGQIWPFRYLVRTQFRFLAGRYDVGSMVLLVCRGTGTFGPRMRLWYPSEMLRITLRPGG